jgi:Tfp pilus assembly protein FimT
MELMITVAVLAVVSAVAISGFGSWDTVGLDSAKRLLISDLEHAQILAISRPGDSISLRLDDDGGGWIISDGAAPDTPLLDAFTGNALSLRFGEGRGRPASGVVASTSSGEPVTFDHHGGLANFSGDAEVTLQSNDATATVSISPATGTIR